MEKNPPRDVLRDGSLKATLWRNESENGPFYSASLSRTYTDAQGEVRDAHSFSGPELLRVSELARKAYDRSQELRREDRGQEPGRETRRDQFRDGRSQQRQSGGPQLEDR